ncbi:hypothetical protein BDE02_02G223600 [Populus trichocarpa]|nr:hypothetical protein BDE02_02G223600 [Populus trichocarpa]
MDKYSRARNVRRLIDRKHKRIFFFFFFFVKPRQLHVIVISNSVV